MRQRQVHPDTGRSTSFGQAAEDYDRIRPSPPAEALRWMLAGLQGGVVLDLAAGTGQVTRMLAGTGPTVIAAEPDEHMRAVLRRRCPHVEVRHGRAENLPLADAGVDAIVVGSAWHWFGAEVAVTEAARVLRPGGRLAVVSTVPDPTVDWIAAMLDGDRRPSGLSGARSQALVRSGCFASADIWEGDVEVGVPRRDVVSLFSTSSRYLIADAEEQGRLRARWHDILAGRQTTADLVQLPLRAWAWRAMRLPVVGESRAGAGPGRPR